MYKFIRFTLVAAALAGVGATVTACGAAKTDEQQIAAVSHEFLDGVKSGDVGAACKVATKTSDCQAAMGLAVVLAGPDGVKELFADGDPKITSLKFNADHTKATATYNTDDEGDDPTEFVKRDGKWLITIEMGA
jgi:hypothetical protein